MDRKKLSLVGLLKKAIKTLITILYTAFLIVLSFGTAIAGILTLLTADASKINLIGYHSTCAFVPISTIILFGLAIVGFILLLKIWKKHVKKSRNSIAYLKYETLQTQK